MALPQRRWRYGLIGASLALGAPAGLLLLRGFAAGELLQLGWVVAELLRDAGLYLYLLASTALVFALFGFVLGRGADRLAELSISDPLTGLLNARVLSARLEVEWGRAARYGGGALLDGPAVQDLVQRLEGTRFGVGARSLSMLLPLLAALAIGGELRAQEAGGEGVAGRDRWRL